MIEDARAIVMQRIDALRFEDDPDELRATSYAIAYAEALLSEATPLPRGSAAVWYDGSIYVHWRMGARRIHLYVPATQEKQPYIYHEHGGDYGIIKPVSPVVVAEWLRWYVEGL